MKSYDLEIFENDSSYTLYKLSDTAFLVVFENGKCNELYLKDLKALDSKIESYLMKYNVKLVKIRGVFNDDIFNHLSDLQVIRFMYTKEFEVAKFYQLKKLREITLEDSYKMKIDFSKFPLLENLTFWWNPNISINLCNKLNWLRIYKFNDKNCNNIFPNNIEFLEIIQSKFNSLIGLENLKKLRSLDLYKLRNVSDFEVIGELSNLEYLSIDGCLKLKDIKWIEKLKKLKSLYLVGSNEIESLKPLFKLPVLEGVKISIKIKDGDKSILKVKNNYKIIRYKSPSDNLLYNFDSEGNIAAIPQSPG